MRFDQSLTAFALESSGAAARALGVCHTLTMPQPALGAVPTEWAPVLLDEPPLARVTVSREPPPSITLTL